MGKHTSPIERKKDQELQWRKTKLVCTAENVAASMKPQISRSVSFSSTLFITQGTVPSGRIIKAKITS